MPTAHARRSCRVRSASCRDKQTHKLPLQQCVLWLPDRRAYLCRVDPCRAEFETVAAPQHAWRLDDEAAEAVGLVFHEMTGLRVALRPYVSTGC